MKKILFCLLASCITLSVFAQSFEGKISYTNAITSKIPTVSSDQFNSMMGTKQEYYIRGGDYKSVVNGTLTLWQLYRSKENKLYTKLANSETIYWNDASANDDSVISIKINKNALEILGYSCDELILVCKSGIQKYYYNSKIGIDDKLYKNHAYGNWFAVLSQIHAVPLKMTIDNEQYSMVSVATQIQPMKLKESDFALPENAKTAKSPY